MNQKLTRRWALQLAGLTSADLLLTACLPPAVPRPTAATLSAQPSLPAHLTPTATAVIVQPATPSAAAFAQYAEEMRQLAIANGDQAYGAIVVRDNTVVGLGPSRLVVLHDATAHAEMEAIRDACRRLGTSDLSGCLLYSTSRACGMCEMAAYWAHIARMFYGPDAIDAGPPRSCSA